jgi:3-carboxy-cis,cis-muconate cycloisomerase
LSAVRANRLAVQFGGPAGTLSDLDDAGLAVVAALARSLDLAEPVLPWHTDRTRIAEVAGALGGLAGVCAKVARDVTLLAQDEVAEVEEGAPGGSSSMAHKRNAVAAVSAIGSAMRAPGLVASLLAAMAHEHERAAGAWHAEWLPLRDLLIATGSAVAWLHTCLAGLRVDPARMRSQVSHGPHMSHVDDAEVGASAALVDRALAEHEKGRPG